MKSMLPRREAYKREIKLLSKGFSAPTAWPEGKITIYPWDSDIDAYLLEAVKDGKGNVLFGVIERVCSLNGASIDQFVLSEINAILLLSRALQFNGAVEYESKCPSCHTTAWEKIKIPEELQPVGEKEVGYPGYDEVYLPDSTDTVRIRPLLVKDQKKIEDRLKNVEWNNLTERHLQILLPIVAIGGGVPDTIEETNNWYKALSPSDAKLLEEKEEELSPHLNNRIPHKCTQCRAEFEHVLMFDQKFFRQRI